MRSGSLVAALVLSACSPAPAPCVRAALPDCSSASLPDFATLQATVLAPRCVVASACHSVAEHSGGLVLETRDQAFTDLSILVTPGDAACSVLAERVTTPNITRRMPPAGGLSDADRCAILAWIEAGAAP